MEFTLLAAALTAVLALWIMLRLCGARSDFDLALSAGAVGLFSGRLVAMVASGVNPLTNPLDILVVRGGIDTVGATVGAVAWLLWSVGGKLDRLTPVAPGAVAALAGWHAGCVWRGTCLGAAGDVAWGWALTGSDIVRHPVELYAAVLMGIAATALSRFPATGGHRAGLALAAVAAVRLLTEPLRPSLSGGPVWWYAAAIAVGLGAAAMAHRHAALQSK